MIRTLGTLPATTPSVQSCSDLGPGFHPEVGPNGMATGYCVGCGQNAVWDGRGCACAPGFIYPGYGQDCVPRYGIEESTQGGSSSDGRVLIGLGVIALLGVGAVVAFSK